MSREKKRKGLWRADVQECQPWVEVKQLSSFATSLYAMFSMVWSPYIYKSVVQIKEWMQLVVMIGDFINAMLDSSKYLCKWSSNTSWSYQLVWINPAHISWISLFELRFSTNPNNTLCTFCVILSSMLPVFILHNSLHSKPDLFYLNYAWLIQCLTCFESSIAVIFSRLCPKKPSEGYQLFWYSL